MNNELLLLSKNDIPFIEAQVNIHQPTIKEISLIGEESFLIGCQFLNFSKNKIPPEGKIGLENKSDFEILMSIMTIKQNVPGRNDAINVLTLLFPDFEFKFTPTDIILFNKNFSTRINKENFDVFKNILVDMFDLKGDEQAAGDYNPADGLARKIAEKLKKRHERLARMQNAGAAEKVAIFSRYISILTVGNHHDMNDLMEYTVYQLKDEFKRFQLKQNFDAYMKAKLAGAKDLDEVDNWMDDIHPSSKNA